MDFLGEDEEGEVKLELARVPEEKKDTSEAVVSLFQYEEDLEREIDEDEEANLMSEGEDDEEEIDIDIEGDVEGVSGGDGGDGGVAEYKDDGKEDVYQSIFSDRERAGGPPPEYTQLYQAFKNGDMKMEEFFRRTGQMGLSVNDRFKMAVGAYYEAVNGNDALTGFDRPYSLTYILSMCDDIPFIKYRNPRGFVLGLKAISRREISKEKLDYIFARDVPKVEDDGVSNEDILRYARWWKLYLI